MYTGFITYPRGYWLSYRLFFQNRTTPTGFMSTFRNVWRMTRLFRQDYVCSRAKKWSKLRVETTLYKLLELSHFLL